MYVNVGCVLCVYVLYVHAFMYARSKRNKPYIHVRICTTYVCCFIMYMHTGYLYSIM